jgi:glutathione S-transferase
MTSDRPTTTNGVGVVGGVRIHGYPVSTWTRTACMVCVEKQIPYELVAIAYGSAEHQRMHPFAKIPVLGHEGTLITEALAITGYLDEAFPGPGLQPTDIVSRTRMRAWLSLCSDYVFREVVRGLPRNRPISEQELATARGVLEKVDRLVGDGPFLVGEQLTLADLYLAPQASNAREKAPELLDPLTRLRAWLSTVEARPSFTDTAYDPTAL